MMAADWGGPGEPSFLPGPVLLLGAPGVGKGTQAQLLMATFGIPQISTGDLLRQHVADATELGRAAKALMDAGRLVPDAIVNGMVGQRLTEADTKQGFVLDGFPRTEAQAGWLDEALRARVEGADLIAIQIDVERAELLRRITGRRSCPTCKRIYNIYSHAPAAAGTCDFDGTVLEHRSDDTEEAFSRRMMEYDLKTAAVIDHYRARGSFRAVNGLGSLEEVEGRIIRALRGLRKADE